MSRFVATLHVEVQVEVEAGNHFHADVIAAGVLGELVVHAERGDGLAEHDVCRVSCDATPAVEVTSVPAGDR